MQRSESIENLTGAMATAILEYKSIAKNGHASFKTKSGVAIEYDYMELSDILEMVRPVFAKHGIWLTQEPVVAEGVVEINTAFYHKSGEFIIYEPFKLPIISSGNNILQSAGTSVTFARRYSLACILGLAGDKDLDANDVSGDPIKPIADIKKPAAKKKNSVEEKPPEPLITEKVEPEAMPIDEDMKAKRKIYIDSIADILTNQVFKEEDKEMMRRNIKQATTIEMLATLKTQCLDVEKIREAKQEKGE